MKFVSRADYHETTPLGEKLYRMEQDVDQVAGTGFEYCTRRSTDGIQHDLRHRNNVVLDFRLTCVLLL